MMPPRQCAVLVGGLGIRLGGLTADTPKPLLNCGGRPFLAWVLRELCRFGIEEVVLLASYQPAKIEAFLREAPSWLPKALRFKLSVEPTPAGTGGALHRARDLLDDTFLLINGDSWLDTDLAAFIGGATHMDDAMGHVLVHGVADGSRYGLVELQAGRISAFREKPSSPAPGLINGGMYVLRKAIVELIAPESSLERDVLPVLARQGLLTGQVMNGLFVDIGIPADYARAGEELPRRLRRPAVFFDRDGVLNEDLGWVGSLDRFRWLRSAKEALRLVNQAGYHAFVVTNQAGVARGHYGESDVALLHNWMERELLAVGATIDDFRFCPHHPDSVLKEFRVVCDCRKPAGGMLNALKEKWEIDLAASFLVGNSQSDLTAAENAGVPGFLFKGGDIGAFVEGILQRRSASIFAPAACKE